MRYIELLKEVANDKEINKTLMKYIKDRLGHDRRYAIDATKIEQELGWKAEENFESGIEKTVEWYVKKYLGKNYEL
jgi:dTDP-glucose 4,6-dehydratase